MYFCEVGTLNCPIVVLTKNARADQVSILICRQVRDSRVSALSIFPDKAVFVLALCANFCFILNWSLTSVQNPQETIFQVNSSNFEQCKYRSPTEQLAGSK